MSGGQLVSCVTLKGSAVGGSMEMSDSHLPIRPSSSPSALLLPALETPSSLEPGVPRSAAALSRWCSAKASPWLTLEEWLLFVA